MGEHPVTSGQRAAARALSMSDRKVATDLAERCLAGENDATCYNWPHAVLQMEATIQATEGAVDAAISLLLTVGEDRARLVRERAATTTGEFTGDITPLVHLFRTECPSEGARGDWEGWSTAETATRLIRSLYEKLDKSKALFVGEARARALAEEKLKAAERSAKLLNWLREQGNGSGWIARESTTGRGYRLHQPGPYTTPELALIAVAECAPLPPVAPTHRALRVIVAGEAIEVPVVPRTPLRHVVHLALYRAGRVPSDGRWWELRDANGVALRTDDAVDAAPLHEPLHLVLPVGWGG